MAVKPVSTPLRRSRRGQPIVSVPLDASSSKLPLNLPEPVFRRMTRPQDLWEEDIEALNDREIPIEDLETHFYDKLTRSSVLTTTKPTTRKYGKKQRGQQSDLTSEEIYRVGDTVLVKTSSKDPSVAVIVAIWSIVGPEVQPTVRVLIHWFLTPSDLPKVRAAHSHEEVE